MSHRAKTKASSLRELPPKKTIAALVNENQLELNQMIPTTPKVIVKKVSKKEKERLAHIEHIKKRHAYYEGIIRDKDKTIATLEFKLKDLRKKSKIKNFTQDQAEMMFHLKDKVLHTVNKAPHYNTGKFEVIDVAEDWGIDKDAYLFNSFKYIARAGKKDPSKTLEDLEKAEYYLKRKITNLKKEIGASK